MLYLAEKLPQRQQRSKPLLLVRVARIALDPPQHHFDVPLIDFELQVGRDFNRPLDKLSDAFRAELSHLHVEMRGDANHQGIEQDGNFWAVDLLRVRQPSD